MTKETKQAFDDRFTREMTETAQGMRKVGVIDDATYKLTMRELNRGRRAKRLRALAPKARLSLACERQERPKPYG